MSTNFSLQARETSRTYTFKRRSYILSKIVIILFDNLLYTIGVVSVNACGLIVEYNPLHNGHLYHIEQAREVSQADCIISVMSGNFLQRGEPAIIDKVHRAKAALQSGVDIVLELPFPYAVQSSTLFAKGAVQTLNQMGVDSICFGSESGKISQFKNSYSLLEKKQSEYQATLKEKLSKGLSFPSASEEAYKSIGFNESHLDLTQPNNILGFSYVREILKYKLPIQPLTIKRQKSGYHETEIKDSIASATSIRKHLFGAEPSEVNIVRNAMPANTAKQLSAYKDKANIWHNWEQYFPILHYKVSLMSHEQLAKINGVTEGLEFRIKKTAEKATTMAEWIEAIKTKRYTWTRIQRIFVYILTDTKKTDLEILEQMTSVPYVRILGFTEVGRNYINKVKKNMDVPLLHNYSREQNPILEIEEKASQAYYSVVAPKSRFSLLKQERRLPIIIKKAEF